MLSRDQNGHQDIDNDSLTMATLASGRDSSSVSVPLLNQVHHCQQKWPFLFWFYVKTLGLYHSGRLVHVKRCSTCQSLPRRSCYHINGPLYGQSPCQVCETFRWDHDGNPTYITDSDIGSGSLNHCGSGFFSLVWLLVITGVTLANIALIITGFDQSNTDVVHAIAWIGMKSILYIPPFTCLVSVIHSTWPKICLGSWASVIDIEFLVWRLRLVNMKGKHIAGYVLFFGSLLIMISQVVKLVAPLFDPSLVSPMDVNATFWGRNTTLPLSLFITVEGLINFGGFCYIVYLLRCSYESEISLVVKFVRRNITNLNLCRAMLAETFDAFHSFREFATGWIAISLITCTVCLLLELHISIVTPNVLAPFQYEHAILLVLFLCLPVLSLGNVDVDYLWNRLLRRMSRQRSMEHEDEWEKVMQFLKEQRSGSRPWQAVLAFFISTGAIFASIQFRLWSFNNDKVITVYCDKNDTVHLLNQLKIA